MDATINGLMDGISVLETNKDEQPSVASDMLYNNQDSTFEGDFVYPTFDYQLLHMDTISLLDNSNNTL